MLKKLKFHLTIHSPFRPLEGFLIDLKVWCLNVILLIYVLPLQTRSSIPGTDQLRKEADSFLLNSLYSDVLFLYPPSQVNPVIHFQIFLTSSPSLDSSCCPPLCFYHYWYWHIKVLKRREGRILTRILMFFLQLYQDAAPWDWWTRIETVIHFTE